MCSHVQPQTWAQDHHAAPIMCLAMAVGGSNVARYPNRRCHSQHMHVRRTMNTSACRFSSYPRGGQVTAIADTGCQSCLIGLKMVYRLGFKQADLLPVEHKMSAANRQAIEITGAVILRLRGADSGGYPVESTTDMLRHPGIRKAVPLPRGVHRSWPHFIVIPNPR